MNALNGLVLQFELLVIGFSLLLPMWAVQFCSFTQPPIDQNRRKRPLSSVSNYFTPLYCVSHWQVKKTENKRGTWATALAIWGSFYAAAPKHQNRQRQRGEERGERNAKSSHVNQQRRHDHGPLSITPRRATSARAAPGTAWDLHFSRMKHLLCSTAAKR